MKTAESALLAALKPGMRVAVADGAGSPTYLLGALSRAAAMVGDVSLILGWTLDLPDDFDPAAFSDVRTVMGGFALREAVAQGTVHYVPERYTGVPSLLQGALRPDALLIALRPSGEGWHWGSEVSWMRSLLDLPELAVWVAENDALPRASRETTINRDRGIVVSTQSHAPIVGPQRPPSEIDRAIAGNVVPFISPGVEWMYGPSPIADAVAEALEVPVTIRSGMITDAVLGLAKRGLVRGVPLGAYLWGSPDLYEWADGRSVVARVEQTHVGDLSAAVGTVTLNAAIEIDHTGAVNVERAGGVHVSGMGGHPDFALMGHQSLHGISIVATPTRRGRHSTLVDRLSGATSTPRSDVDVVVTEMGAADLRGLSDAERSSALRSIWP